MKNIPKLTFFGGIFLLLKLVGGLTADHKMENFIRDLIQTFPDCALFFGRHADDGSEARRANLFDFTKLVHNLGIVASYSAIFPSEQYFTTLKKNDKVLASTSNSSIDSIFAESHFSLKLNGYNRRASVCKFVIICVDQLQPEFLALLKKNFSPVFTPMLRLEYDPWIWITSSADLLQPLLMSEALPALILHKLGISLAPPSGELVVTSVCFFCNRGLPVFVNLPVASPTTFSYFPDNVVNLMGKLLRITIPAVKSRVEADPPYKGINNAKRGLWKALLEEYLMPKLNFTYNVFLSSGKDGGRGGGTGLQLQDGSWIGTVGDLVNDKADVAFITGMTPQRIKAVTYTNSFFDLSHLYFITTQGARVFSPAALLWPFDLLMWGCILFCTILAFCVFKFLTWSMKLLKLDSGNAMTFSHRGVTSSKEWGIGHQIFFVVTTYLDQDCVMPVATPLRCFVALWIFFTLIITTVYRSKMVSLLAFPILEKVPQTFEELAFSKYQVGFLKHGDAAYNTFKHSTDPVYVKLVNEMEIVTGNGLECLSRVVSKKYACIAYTVSTVFILAKNLSDSDIRQLVFSPDHTFNIFLGMALQGGSIYKESFERLLSWTRPYHLAAMWEDRDMYYTVRSQKRLWWHETNQTDKLAPAPVGGADEDLTLKHISGAFLALLGCYVICTAVFVQELVYYYKGKFLRKRAALKRARTKIKLVMAMNSNKFPSFDNYETKL